MPGFSLLALPTYSLSLSNTLERQSSSFINDLDCRELMKLVYKLRLENKLLDLENIVLYNYLNKNEPKYLEGMQRVLDQVGKIQQQQTKTLGSYSTSRLSIKSSSSRFSIISGDSMSKRRINVQTRLELITREFDLESAEIDAFHKYSKTKLTNIKHNLEELSVRLTETIEARAAFENMILCVDPITQRVPAEKIIRFMEDWLKSADAIIEKLRLRTLTLRYKYMNLRNQRKAKEELGDSIFPVDLDSLQVENRRLIATLEEKNMHLLDMKKTTGKINLVLTETKNYILSLTREKKEIVDKIIERKQMLDKLKKEINHVLREVKISQDKYNYIKDLNANCTVPSIMDYCRSKRELRDLKWEINVWTRKNKLIKSDLESCIRTMKRMTGVKFECEEWYINESRNSSSTRNKRKTMLNDSQDCLSIG